MLLLMNFMLLLITDNINLITKKQMEFISCVIHHNDKCNIPYIIDEGLFSHTKHKQINYSISRLCTVMFALNYCVVIENKPVCKISAR